MAEAQYIGRPGGGETNFNAESHEARIASVVNLEFAGTKLRVGALVAALTSRSTPQAGLQAAVSPAGRCALDRAG